jgi:hypothetical protein
MCLCKEKERKRVEWANVNSAVALDPTIVYVSMQNLFRLPCKSTTPQKSRATANRLVHTTTAFLTGIYDTNLFPFRFLPKSGFAAGEKTTNVLASAATQPKKVPFVHVCQGSSEFLPTPSTVCINHQLILVNIFHQSYIITRQSLTTYTYMYIHIIAR